MSRDVIFLSLIPNTYKTRNHDIKTYQYPSSTSKPRPYTDTHGITNAHGITTGQFTKRNYDLGLKNSSTELRTARNYDREITKGRNTGSHAKGT